MSAVPLVRVEWEQGLSCVTALKGQRRSLKGVVMLRASGEAT